MTPQQDFSLWDGWVGLLGSLLDLKDHNSPIDLLQGMEHSFGCLITHEDGYAELNFGPVF